MLTWSFPLGSASTSFTLRAIADDDGQGGSVYNQCREDNNIAQAPAPQGCGVLQ